MTIKRRMQASSSIMMRVPVAAIALLLVGSLVAGVPIVSAQTHLAESWRDLSPKERYQSLRNYWRHEQLPQEQQREVEQRYQRWRSMSPDERARVRKNYERFKKLPPRERERFQRKYDKWRRQSETPSLSHQP
jgi:hypothetical protein